MQACKLTAASPYTALPVFREISNQRYIMKMGLRHPACLLLSRSLLCLSAAILMPEATADGPANQRPGCQPRCGDVDIPFPFGVGDGCAIHRGFQLKCNFTTNSSKPKLLLGDFEVTKISVQDGKFWTKMSISTQCYNRSTRGMTYSDASSNITGDPPMWFSAQDNKIIVIGCNTLAYMLSDSYVVGCSSTCNNTDLIPKNGSCIGGGCCEADVPKRMSYYQGYFDEDHNTTEIWNNSPCSYMAVIETAAFNFSVTYLNSTVFNDTYHGKVPVVLDWVIADDTCDEAKRNTTSYACVSSNSNCIHFDKDGGYRCNCSDGYGGNPYIKDGCQDINECLDNTTYPCPGICENTIGGFICSCPQGQHKVQGVCVPDQKTHKSSWMIPVVGASIGLVILVVTATCSYLIHERRKLQYMKQKYFKQHGGLLLFEEMKSNQGTSFTVFSEEELQQATNKFDKDKILGHGGHGTVYKGLLQGSIEVAVKRCTTMDEQHKKEFGKEMLILSQINHINIVRLLGCCLEVQVPMLVYEFIPNGTLSNLIHGNHGQHISLFTRLRIAHESGEALAYLHSYASPPIIHGDVKSSNILLDVNLKAKVSDFGASILAPMDKSQLVTLVQGTWGYLDPEYMQTCQLTDKSDVYSFGVVLVELLTRKNVFNLDAPEHEKSLSMRFLSAIKENKLEDILDDQISSNENMELLEEVADLAKQCLAMSGQDRPSMKEIAERLDRLTKVVQHPWAQQNPEEMESLLGESSYITRSVVESAGNFSIEKNAIKGLESGR